MRLQIGRVDHDDFLLTAFGGQPFHHPGEDPHVAPSLPAVVERLGRTILPWRIAPPQPIAVDEDYPAQHTPVIDPRLAVALRKERPQPLHLLVGQPEKVAHHHPRQFGSLNHAGDRRPQADQWVLTLGQGDRGLLGLLALDDLPQPVFAGLAPAARADLGDAPR
jgi:hypothetical protein